MLVNKHNKQDCESKIISNNTIKDPGFFLFFFFQLNSIFSETSAKKLPDSLIQIRFP